MALRPNGLTAGILAAGVLAVLGGIAFAFDSAPDSVSFAPAPAPAPSIPPVSADFAPAPLAPLAPLAADRAEPASQRRVDRPDVGAEEISRSLTKPKGRFGRQITLLDEPMSIPDYVFEERRPDGTRRDHGMLEFRGRVVVLNFWASWCGVCAKEMPKFDAIAPGLSAGRVDVIALSIDDDIEIAIRALEKRGHDELRVFHDTGRVLSSLLGVRGVPTTFVIDPAGQARAVVQGPAEWQSPEALAWLRSLAEPDAPTKTPVSASLR